jgi:beta-glucanase (GH16 family)
VLNITTELKENLYKAFDEDTKKFFADSKHIQSAMLQGWNKFCITGGIVEFSAKLPGDPFIGGLWPACKYNLFFLFFWLGERSVEKI